MVNLASHPIYVADVRLDTLAYAVTEHSLNVPGTRPGDQPVPGADGVIPSLWDDAEPGQYGLTIFVRGSNDDGVGSGIEGLHRNLDEIVHLFRGRPDRLLRIRRVVRDSGVTEKVADVKVVDVIPIQDDGLGTATVRVGCLIPDSYWGDAATQDNTRTGDPSGGVYAVPTLFGATAPIHDAIYTVTGPVTNPRLTDPTTGAFVQLNQALTAGQVWRVNSGTWSSRVGTLTLASADTTGTDVTAATTFQGGSSRYLSLVPDRTDRDSRGVYLSLSGTGMTAATARAIRARRRFLA